MKVLAIIELCLSVYWGVMFVSFLMGGYYPTDFTIGTLILSSAVLFAVVSIEFWQNSN